MEPISQAALPKTFRAGRQGVPCDRLAHPAGAACGRGAFRVSGPGRALPDAACRRSVVAVAADPQPARRLRLIPAAIQFCRAKSWDLPHE